MIDEVQKVPQILNVVHQLIENQSLNTKFALTGSSARKLKRGSANMLAGRAFVNNLYPLTHKELNDDFDLDSVLSWGSLPKIFSLSSNREKAAFLRAYGQTYIKEEVWAEHLIDKLEPFRKFLPVCAQMSGEILNYSAIAKDVLVHDKTVKSYYQILEDTLLGFILEPFHESLRKRQKKSPKFYLFDTGVWRALRGDLAGPLGPGYDYGKAFEQLVIAEIHRLASYQELDARFSYICTDSAEIDLIIERTGFATVLIEVKSSSRTSLADAKHLLGFRQSFGDCACYVLSQDPSERIEEDIIFLPWQKGIQEIGFTGQP